MKTKGFITLILFSIISFFSACNNKDEILTIRPEIYEYSPSVSSVPGIALIAVFGGDLKNSDYKFHWFAEQGTFLTWHEDGKGRIDVLGNDIKTNVHKIYWSVDTNQKIEGSSFKIVLSIEEIYTSEVIYETSIQIDQNKEGFFTIKK